MAVSDASIAAVLREWARQQPDALAYTYIDYEIDPAGYSQTLTWSELYGHVQALAAEVASCGAPGDRAAILAPQGLDYVVAFYAALEAGFVAVPLPVPQFGAHDERASAALQDCAPTVLLTTTAVVDDVVGCARSLPGKAPALIEVDSLDLDGEPNFHAPAAPRTKNALLQYTSGSTRSPAAVVVTHKNILANCQQVREDYFEAEGAIPPSDTTLVSWLPVYHDMGLLLGVTGALTMGLHSVLMSPMAFLQRPARWVQQMARNTRVFTAVPNFAFELAARRTTDEDMAGLDLSGVHTILSGSERVHAATIRRFVDRFAEFGFPASSLKPSYGLAEAMVYVNSSARGVPRRSRRSTTRSCPPATPRRATPRTESSWSASVSRAHRRFGSSTRRPASRTRPEWSVRSGCMAITSPPATGASRSRRRRPSAGSLSIRRAAPRWDRGCGPVTWASSTTASCSSSAASRTC